MQWVRIVDRTANFSFAQEFLESIALLDSNGVLAVDVFKTFGRERRHDAGDLREEPVVLRGVRPAGTPATCQKAQLYSREPLPRFGDTAVPVRVLSLEFYR